MAGIKNPMKITKEHRSAVLKLLTDPEKRNMTFAEIAKEVKITTSSAFNIARQFRKEGTEYIRRRKAKYSKDLARELLQNEEYKDLSLYVLAKNNDISEGLLYKYVRKFIKEDVDIVNVSAQKIRKRIQSVTHIDDSMRGMTIEKISKQLRVSKSLLFETCYDRLIELNVIFEHPYYGVLIEDDYKIEENGTNPLAIIELKDISFRILKTELKMIVPGNVVKLKTIDHKNFICVGMY